MRAILIVLVVFAATSMAVAGPRITVVMQSGGGCGPVYVPRPCPPVYRSAPHIYGGNYGYQSQLVRCSACFQVRRAGTICPCQQRYDGGPGSPIGCNIESPYYRGECMPRDSDPFSRAYREAYESKADSLERQEFQRQINSAAQAGRRDAERHYYYGR